MGSWDEEILPTGGSTPRSVESTATHTVTYPRGGWVPSSALSTHQVDPGESRLPQGGTDAERYLQARSGRLKDQLRLREHNRYPEPKRLPNQDAHGDSQGSRYPAATTRDIGKDPTQEHVHLERLGAKNTQGRSAPRASGVGGARRDDYDHDISLERQSFDPRLLDHGSAKVRRETHECHEPQDT